MDRDIRSIERDLNRGLISIEAAKSVYGVVASGTRTVAGRAFYELDAVATEKQQAGST